MEDSVVHWFRESQESCPLYCQWFNAWLWEISSFSVSASLSPKVRIMLCAYFVWDLKTLVYSKEKINKSAGFCIQWKRKNPFFQLSMAARYMSKTCLQGEYIERISIGAMHLTAICAFESIPTFVFQHLLW